MSITPDDIVFWQWGLLRLNATIVLTWIVMIVLTLISWLVTRRLSAGSQFARWQNALEVLVTGIHDQIHEVSGQEAGLGQPEPQTKHGAREKVQAEQSKQADEKRRAIDRLHRFFHSEEGAVYRETRYQQHDHNRQSQRTDLTQKSSHVFL